MAANNGQIIRYQGDAFTLSFPLYDASGAPLSLASPVGTFRLTASQTPADAVILSKDTASIGGASIAQQTINGKSVWVLTVSFVPSDTLTIDPGSHYYSFRIVDGTYAETLGFGIIRLLEALP